MGFINKIKSKIFPDEKEVLYYSSNNESKENDSSVNETKVSDMYVTPRDFSQTRELADKLKNGATLTIDISLLSKQEALRMIDFLGGVMYALNGDMKKISKYVFEYSVSNNK